MRNGARWYPVLIKTHSSLAPKQRLVTDCTRLPLSALWPQREHTPQARHELVRRNLPLARSLAARYRNPTEPFDDLVQVASLALIKAVDRFDPERGAPFSVYATPTILGELRRHFRDTAWSVHVPRGAQELALKVQRAADELLDRNGRSPRVQELALYLELSTEEVLVGLEANQSHYASSLDAPVGGADADEGETSFLDQTGGDDDRFSLAETSVSLEAGIRMLPPPEQQALVLRLEHDLTQTEIAHRLGCSQMQVSRLLRQAANRLREYHQA